MRIILTLIFIFFFTGITHADKITKGCTGYCEDEEYIFKKTYFIDENKNLSNEKVTTLTSARGMYIKDTSCIIFFSTIDRSVPNINLIKNKKKKKEILKKTMDEYKKGSTIFRANYEINSCMPCPPDTADKNNKSGFCSIPMFSVDVWYKDAFVLGFVPKEWGNYDNDLKLGREDSGDLQTDLNEANKNILLETIKISSSIKENFYIYRFIPLENNEFNRIAYYYYKTKYKTPFKLQEIKRSKAKYVTDVETYKWLNNFIYFIQNSFSEVFTDDEESPYFKDRESLYELIPNKEIINALNKEFKGIKKFHIQTRN